MSEVAVLDPTAVAPEGTAAVGAAAADSSAAAGVVPVTPVVPEKYTLTLPEGSLLSPDALTRITETAKALKVASDADAQALVGLAHAEASEVIKTYESAKAPGGELYKHMVAQYETDSLKHPQLGNGDPVQLERKALQAGLVLNKFAPELAPILKDTGFAARPEVLLMLNRIHDAMSEKALAMPTKDAPPPAVEPLEKRMYPKRNP